MARVPEKKGKKGIKKPQKKAVNIQEIEMNCEKILQEKDLLDDPKFMRKLAQDIKKLNEDAQASEEIFQLDPSVHMIHHTTETLWGDALMPDRALLDTSVSFEFQDLHQSDLSHIMLDLRNYNSIGENNQVFVVLDSIYEDLYEDLED